MCSVNCWENVDINRVFIYQNRPKGHLKMMPLILALIPKWMGTPIIKHRREHPQLSFLTFGLCWLQIHATLYFSKKTCGMNDQRWGDSCHTLFFNKKSVAWMSNEENYATHFVQKNSVAWMSNGWCIHATLYFSKKKCGMNDKRLVDSCHTVFQKISVAWMTF